MRSGLSSTYLRWQRILGPVASGLLLASALMGGIAFGAPRPSDRAARPVRSRSNVIHLSGAGSTFDAPFFMAAFARYHKLHPNVSIAYSAVGSGDGIQRFSAKAVNFGASDVPMTPLEQAAAQGGPVIQVPIDLGAVVVSYNVQTATPGWQLHLSGAVLAKIYLGQITNWDDPAIAALNPGVGLPSENIVVVHRSDSSGTTYIFTNYLSSVAPEWTSGPGTNKLINWPVGFGGTGSTGVAALLKRTPGAIGYFELSYAEAQSLPYALIENQSGNFIPPLPSNVASDAAMKVNVSSTNFSIVNEPGPESYPICGYSWMLVYKYQFNSMVGTALARLVDWMVTDGQAIAATNYYVPLPSPIRVLASYSVAKITSPQGRLLSR